MSDSKALSPIEPRDYEAIEAAVMETQRGRWFLAEYARRNRNADTTTILSAIERLENAVASERESDRMDRLRFDLVEMARAITSTKREIAAIRPAEGSSSDLEVASEALDGIVRTTERATSDILEAAEHVQEAAWTLREDGAREDLCDELDRRATEIYTSCSFQDLTAQRTRRIIETLRFLEGRINAMIDIWGVTVDDEGSAAEDADERRDTLQTRLDVYNGLDQDAIDGVIVEDAVLASEPRDDAAFVEPVVALRRPPARAMAAEVSWRDAARQIEPQDLEVEDADEASAQEIVEAGHETVDADAAETSDGFDAEALLARADAVIAQGESGLDLDAFADIEALSTREKLARFS